MGHYQPRVIRQFFFLMCFLSLGGCVVHTSSTGGAPERVLSINKALIVTPETVHAKDISAVNGRVHVGTGITVNDVSSVNGRILIDTGATARSVRSINGRVELRDDISVAGDVDTINGRISAFGGSIGGNASTISGRIKMSDVSVGKTVETSNGAIELTSVKVGENVETRLGDIKLDYSVVEQDVIIHRRSRFNLFWIPLRHLGKSEVVIGPETEVKGNLIAHEDIRLYVHESARVNNIVGAEPILYNGRRP